jgi:hypothetical protein
MIVGFHSSHPWHPRVKGPTHTHFQLGLRELRAAMPRMLASERRASGLPRMLVLNFVAAAAGVAHGAGHHAHHMRQGNSYYLDGQFQGFALETQDRRSEDAAVPTIRINTTAPLVAGSSCAGAAPYVCGSNGAWVEVSGQCSSSSGVWWAGIFPASAPAGMHTIDPSSLPGNNTGTPWTPPFIVPAPLKFSTVHCDYNLSKGADHSTTSRQWWLPNTREPVVLILFSGSVNSATEAARSRPITFTEPTAPMHLHLSRTSSISQMRVSWTSSCPEESAVLWGTDPSDLNARANATSTTYTADDMCGEPAKTMGWWEPHSLHTAVLILSRRSGEKVGVAQQPPAPKQTFFYKVTGCGLSSELRSFCAPAVGPKTTLTAVLTADMGASTPDRISQHWAEYQAYATTSGMANLVENGFEGNTVDVAFNVGDLSYATGYLGKWETFMNAISDHVSSKVPYMVQMGNHEQDWLGTETIGGPDSGGECGVPTSSRFVMPSAAQEQLQRQRQRRGLAAAPHDAPYSYSFDQGPVHFVMVNTEMPLSPGSGADESGDEGDGPSGGLEPPSAQWTWLAADLKAVDRSTTPWVVVMGHRPNFAQPAVEDLLWESGVDLTVAGHVHLAQRTCPLKHGACVPPSGTGAYDGVIHVIAGNGGQALNNATNNGFPNERYPYVGSGCNWNAPGANCSASKKITGSTQGSGTEFGYSAFVANATHLRYAFIGNNDSRVHYEFWLRRAFPRQP